MFKISKTITSSKIEPYLSTSAQDLLHETIIILYKTTKEKIIKLLKKKQLIFWTVRIMINQFHSKTSPYYYKYKKYYKHVDTNYNLSILWSEHWINNIPEDNTDIDYKKQVEERLNFIDEKLQNQNWFDAELFKVYYMKSHSLNTLAKETGINRSTIYKSIKNVKTKLKNEK